MGMLSDCLYFVERTDEIRGNSFVFSKQSKQEMFRLNTAATSLAGFIPSEEDDAAGFFSQSLQHNYKSCPGIPMCRLAAPPL
jgi:hypothetical protein